MLFKFLHRLAQIWERGILDKIQKHYTVLKEPKQPSTNDVSMVTVAPIFVVLAAGYILGIFVLLIERCVHGNLLKCWPRGSEDGGIMNTEACCTFGSSPNSVQSCTHWDFFTYCCMILFNSIFSSVSRSIIRSVTFRLSTPLCHSALNPTVHTVCGTDCCSREKKFQRQMKTEAAIKW